jgi:hypothetical protein
MSNLGRIYVETIHGVILQLNDKTYLFDMIKNNKLTILELSLYNYYEYSFYSELFELLQTNTSVSTLKITCYNNDDKFCESLYELLSINTSINTFHLMCAQLIIKNSKLLCSVLKNNCNIININFYGISIDNDTFTYLVELLKTNNTLTHLTMDGCFTHLVDGNILAKLLKVNKTLNYIIIKNNIMDRNYKIVKALEFNTTITGLSGSSYFNNNRAIVALCKRNEHNINLKGMRLQDM